MVAVEVGRLGDDFIDRVLGEGWRLLEVDGLNSVLGHTAEPLTCAQFVIPSSNGADSFTNDTKFPISPDHDVADLS
ncbi:hypothetical protein GCM10027535_05900 [Mycolicibacterium hippocampi]|uniref:Uncharacterized protein n=1 Tax=Mycolicibacterium hippocampi TaxID=659824 RepID=A0A7I9ZKZ8_9MYCO|nr:hypothetical protein MHIP_19490 [Mycolicibacterium hippocampi]